MSVVRLSGPKAFETAEILVGPLPEFRCASLRSFRNLSGDLIDQALVLVFEEGHSFTGEPVVEFQMHGSPAVVSAVLETLGAMTGCRIAEPGEFARRALENEMLDLPQIEGLGDLIEAETEAQRRQAIRVFRGELGAVAEGWRKDLLTAAALVEATIDFADEEVPVDVSQDVVELLGKVQRELEEQQRGFAAAERIRDGFEVALVGATNVGKSTLLNRLAGREAAITSEIAGTTRDVIEVRMDIDGLPVTILDTAGLRESDDTIEAIGIARTRERAAQADLRVFLLENASDAVPAERRAGDLVLVGKADLANGGEISGKTGFGVDRLLSEISKAFETRAIGAGVAIKLRHKVAIDVAVGAVRSAIDRMSAEGDAAELVAEDIRSATRSLDSLVGRVDVEDILGEIFSRFCVGK